MTEHNLLSGATVKVQFYLMEEVKEEEPIDSGRKHAWLPLEKAVG